jgi:hypothetical protein
MLDFPLWKKLAVLLVCLAGLLVAMPNAFYGRVERANDARLALVGILHRVTSFRANGRAHVL